MSDEIERLAALAAAGIDYGEDFSCIDDLEEELRVISDPKILLAQALVRRWSTPRGRLLDDEDFGTDLTDFVNEDVDNLTLVRMRSEMRAEALKDERVVSCTILSSSFDVTTGLVAISVAIEASQGVALRLKVAVSELTVELLSVE